MRKYIKSRENAGSVGASGGVTGEREMQRCARGESESGARADAAPGSVRLRRAAPPQRAIST